MWPDGSWKDSRGAGQLNEEGSPTQSPSHTGTLFIDPETGSMRRTIVFALCLVGSFYTAFYLVDRGTLPRAGPQALFILLLAASLWVTEAIPAFAVGILVIGMKIALLGKPGGAFATTAHDWEKFIAVMGHPLVWLFFGGFVLAAGMAKTGLDRRLAMLLLPRFGSRPSAVLLGVMSVTFLLSMFISNTATTAMMLAMLMPLVASNDICGRYRRGLLLGLAVAANLGGMGSLIGTPPNAIAVAALAEVEPSYQIGFLQWLFLGLPPGVASLLLAWVVLARAFASAQATIPLDFAEHTSDHGHPASPQQWQTFTVSVTFLATLLLWLTSQWHQIPTAAVSFLPIVVFTTTGVLGAKEIRGLNYDVLFLIAGGLALGETVTETGLSQWIVARLPLEGFDVLGVTILMAYLTVVLSNFMSNTAAANVLIPIGVTIATGFEARVALPIAFAASAAMCLPVATPPNALAFATGYCQVRDFLWLGLLIGLIVPMVGIGWLWLTLDSVLALTTSGDARPQVEVVIGPRQAAQGGDAATSGPLDFPFGVDFDRSGNLYVVEMTGGRVLKRDVRGKLTTIAGRPEAGYSGDGGPAAQATFREMHNLAVDAEDNLFIADSSNHCIRRIDAKTGVVTTFSGNGQQGFDQDTGNAKSARYKKVISIAFNPSKDALFVADIYNVRIRRIDMAHDIVETVAGTGRSAVPRDGDAAVASPLVDPRAVAADGAGNVYILERAGHALRVVDRQGKIRTVAGNGKKGYRDGTALQAQFDGPKHLCLDDAGNVYIADDGNHAIRKYDPYTATVTTVLGRGHGDAEYTLNKPHGVAWHDGWLYVVDSGNNRILRMRP
ncbi:MAG: hypothetical protein DWQ31_07120 [Planctomycetota bacterium]|nr:MAG: hypothetical protein DWQ31_07120 [Planctomycetota bacterium]